MTISQRKKRNTIENLSENNWLLGEILEREDIPTKIRGDKSAMEELDYEEYDWLAIEEKEDHFGVKVMDSAVNVFKNDVSGKSQESKQVRLSPLNTWVEKLNFTVVLDAHGVPRYESLLPGSDQKGTEIQLWGDTNPKDFGNLNFTEFQPNTSPIKPMDTSQLCNVVMPQEVE